MQETQTADGGNNSADGQTVNANDVSKPQTVKYETYDKAMATLAKEKQRAQELEKQLNDIREKEMLSQGKYQELLQEREQELKEMRENLLKEKTEKFVTEAKSVMTDLANKYGAHSSEDIHKNINLKDVTGVDGRIDPKLVEAKVSELKATKSYLFKGQSARVVDGVPVTTIDTNVNVNKMSVEQLAALYRQKALNK